MRCLLDLHGELPEPPQDYGLRMGARFQEGNTRGDLLYDQEIRSKQVTEDSRFLMQYIFAPASERGALYKARPRVGDGVNLKILMNDEQIWPEKGWEHSNHSADRRHHDFKVNVSAGDKLYFLVNMNQGMGFDSTYWNPAITYDDGTTYQASKGFSGTQG